MTQKHPELSVVVPAYNEQDNIQSILEQLHKVLDTLVSFEIIFVNDGSRDKTLDELHKAAKNDQAIRIISFSRNFGKELATSAGIHYAQGDAIIMVDADGQFPPELIPEFVKKWRNGAQVVTGVRVSNQKEGFIKRYGSKLFYKLMSSLAGAKLTAGATDFRLIDRAVQQEFFRFSERSRMTRGLIDWVGFKEDFIEFHARERMAGEASYKVSKLIKLALNSFVSLSLAPLYFSGWAGIIITPLAFLIGLFIGIEQFVLDDPLNLNITGTAMLGVLILFFMGILLISQGLIALYISHIHTETQNRPLYIIDRRASHNISFENDV
jgi:dolichol-phosphate mannosyltransferase